ncbi:hypothetical protein BCR33DRAFT_791454 [Rhizoclosmatium globosum]|uniref:Uncharacterized protein n=1 Tax=Rhizoclosmatium globosum TaxID=329046 RepID=A0A1Y2BEN7_9FUNG|nr:hypothetical protein BCR33DRAFT_791454 [Rhizoclosmatium globosum]|eukprot:ORY33224.1 hypothetical protein BCR33DRAFT_791454 [Rhizoclosmatium globosum]
MTQTQDQQLIHRTTIESVPPEVISQIIQLLPIDEHLQSLGLASKKVFAPWILNDVAFAATHITAWLDRNGANLDQAPYLLNCDDPPKRRDYHEDSDESHSDRFPMTYLSFGYKAGFYKLAFSVPLKELTGIEIHTSFVSVASHLFMKKMVWSNTLALKLVKTLQSLQSFNISSQMNRLLVWCCYFGYKDAVVQLLADPNLKVCRYARVNPSLHENRGSDTQLPWSYSSVQRLLEIHVLTELQELFCLQVAATKKKWPLVDVLLSIPGMNPSVGNDILFYHACLDGRVELVERLLKDPRVNPASEDNRSFIAACGRAANGNVAVERAIQIGHYRIVALLINIRAQQNFDLVQSILTSRPDVDPNHSNALREACIHGNSQIVKLLLEDGRHLPVTTNPLFLEMKPHIAKSFFNISNLLLQKWEQAGLHLLHHNLRLSDNIDKMVFSPGSNIGEYLSFQLKEACKYFDDLSIESILTHPLWDPKQDEVIDTVLPYIAQLKRKDNSLILSVLKHRRYTQCKTVVEGTFHAQVVRFAHTILFPTFSLSPFENGNELLRWAINNNLDAFVNLLVEDDRIGDISGDDHYVLSTAAANCRFGETFESLCRHNAKWIRKHKIVSENQNDDNWRIFCTIVEEGIDSFLEHVPRLLKWAVEGNLTLVLEKIGFKSGIEVDLAYSDNEPLAIATNKHWCPMVEMLLKNEKVDPLSRNYSGIRKSVEYGCAVCVRSFIGVMLRLMRIFV